MAENSKIEWTDRVCELEDELAAVRAELERALVVVQAAVAYAKADGPEAMMPLLSLEHAVSAWKAGRCVLAGDAADALRAALSEAEKRRKPCTCHDTSRGPGRPCAVKAGTNLGKLWQCVEEPRRESAQAKSAEASGDPAPANNLPDWDNWGLSPPREREGVAMNGGRGMRNTIWNAVRSKVPEGMILPWWALAVRAVLFPLDFLFWRMSQTRGYQWDNDTWVIEGVTYSGAALRWLANAQGETYRAQLATERAALQANSTCIWQQDGEGSDLWQTSCHQAFTINDGDPSDNSMAYCCFCGRRLEESPWPEDEDEAGGEG